MEEKRIGLLFPCKYYFWLLWLLKLISHFPPSLLSYTLYLMGYNLEIGLAVPFDLFGLFYCF